MKLWDYLNKEYGLILLESEINDILEIARQEIELPNEQEMFDTSTQYLSNTRERRDNPLIYYILDDFESGWKQALDKVRNPYPKTM